MTSRPPDGGTHCGLPRWTATHGLPTRGCFDGAGGPTAAPARPGGAGGPPVPVADVTDAVALAVGEAGWCVVRGATREVECELGDRRTTIPGLADITDVSLGGHYSSPYVVALQRDGTALHWGSCDT